MLTDSRRNVETIVGSSSSGSFPGNRTWQQFRKWRECNPTTPQSRSSIVNELIDVLKDAGRTNTPLSKIDLLEKLAAKFPGRKMDVTLNNLLSRLSWMYGVDVSRKRLPDKRYVFWIVDGK